MQANENFILIQGFMVNELGLKGNELLTYAIIYGFSQDGESEFTGSTQYLQFWLGATKANVINTLKRLVDKRLVIKRDREINGIHLPVYRANLDLLTNNTGGIETIPVVSKQYRWYRNNTGGIETIPGGIETIPNNIEDNIEKKEKKEINKERKERKFVVPSVEEIRAYCEERQNEIDPQYFWDFYNAKGWKIGKAPMKSWKSCIRTWEARKQNGKPERAERDYSEFYL